MGLDPTGAIGGALSISPIIEADMEGHSGEEGDRLFSGR